MISTNLTKQISRLDFLDFFIKKSREKMSAIAPFVGSSTNLTNNELFELFFGRFSKCSVYVDHDLVKDGFISINSTINLHNNSSGWIDSNFIRSHLDPIFIDYPLDYLGVKSFETKKGSRYNIWGAHTIIDTVANITDLRDDFPWDWEVGLLMDIHIMSIVLDYCSKVLLYSTQKDDIIVIEKFLKTLSDMKYSSEIELNNNVFNIIGKSISSLSFNANRIKLSPHKVFFNKNINEDVRIHFLRLTADLFIRVDIFHHVQGTNRAHHYSKNKNNSISYRFISFLRSLPDLSSLFGQDINQYMMFKLAFGSLFDELSNKNPELYEIYMAELSDSKSRYFDYYSDTVDLTDRGLADGAKLEPMGEFNYLSMFVSSVLFGLPVLGSESEQGSLNLPFDYKTNLEWKEMQAKFNREDHVAFFFLTTNWTWTFDQNNVFKYPKPFIQCPLNFGDETFCSTLLEHLKKDFKGKVTERGNFLTFNDRHASNVLDWFEPSITRLYSEKFSKVETKWKQFVTRSFNNIEVLHVSKSLRKLLYYDTLGKPYKYIGDYLTDHLKDQDSDVTDSIIDNFIDFDNMRVDNFPWALKKHRIWRYYANPRQSERLFLTDVLLLDEFEDFFKPEHLSRLKKARVDLYKKVELTGTFPADYIQSIVSEFTK